MNTLEGNKLIAEFMGVNKLQTNDREMEFLNPIVGEHQLYYAWNDLKFHTSWDWLMPCIVEMERIGARVEIVRHVCRITITRDREFEFVTSENLTKLEATYKTVLEFIQWYHTQQ